jgi:hydroxymethylpyrimidine pyrophosphatase-like HAD family hydrolase
MTSRFTEKLNCLPQTVALLAHVDTGPLAAGIEAGRTRHAIAVGSGGSAISAEFFARCRETLWHGPTSVETPMQFVLGAAEISDSDVWLFSAGADNPDVLAAVRTAFSRRARSVHVVTRGPSGLAASEAAASGGHVHSIPVAEAKDGFLATHSLVATVGILLLAADRASGDTVGPRLFEMLNGRIQDALSHEIRARARKMFKTLDLPDTLILLADPQLRPVSVLLETSAWEAGICAVQLTDFRNFAHGRHTWIHHRADRSLILALTGRDSSSSWQPLEDSLPLTQRRAKVDFGDCGRFANAVGIVEGLVLIEAMGDAVGIDPGKPGIGPFGREMYENDALRRVAAALPSSIRQKRETMFRRDDPEAPGVSLAAIEEERLQQLGEAEFGGIVLDYDGTIVRTADRFAPPAAEIVRELERLHRAGLRIGIATGRGGSAGKDLRAVLDPSIHPSIAIGYYNGGYVQMLDVDIKKNRPPPDGGIDEAVAWLETRQDLFRKFEMPNPGVQITIQMDDLLHPERFALDAGECRAVAEGRVKIARSAHSFDIITAAATKLNAVRAVADQLDEHLAVLCVGDSGSRHGNDYALLSNPYGISVGEVCGAPDGCWSLFGDHVTGPDALLKVLRALIPSGSGGIRLDVASLTLDRR